MAAGLKFGKLLKEVAAPALTSGSLAGGFALLTGASPIQALATAAAWHVWLPWCKRLPFAAW